MYDLKSAPAVRVVISLDEKTWMVDPVRTRKMDRSLSFSEEDERVCTFSPTKHPESVMSLRFVASNGAMMLLIRFPSGYRLAARDYEEELN